MWQTVAGEMTLLNGLLTLFDAPLGRENKGDAMARLLSFGFIAIMALASCDSPHPAFMGVEAQKITVQGSTFRVRIRENYAEAIRTNFERIPKIGEIFPKAKIAMEAASGCRVVADTMKGDPARMMAKLDCG